jgi:hypothetical protein
MIVKVQKPLNPLGDQMCFVYAEGHRHQRLILMENLPLKVKKALRHSFKVYFEAEVFPDRVEFGDRVGDQNW